MHADVPLLHLPGGEQVLAGWIDVKPARGLLGGIVSDVLQSPGLLVDRERGDRAATALAGVEYLAVGRDGDVGLADAGDRGDGRVGNAITGRWRRRLERRIRRQGADHLDLIEDSRFLIERVRVDQAIQFAREIPPLAVRM